MANRKKRLAGPQDHAEGQHGGKTHQRFLEQLQEQVSPRHDVDETSGRRVDAHHRLHQGRQQHDEAEKNSEKTEELR